MFLFAHLLSLSTCLQAQVKSRFQCVISLEAKEAGSQPEGTRSTLEAAMSYEEVTAATKALNTAKQQVAALKRKVDECAAEKNFLGAAAAQTELDKKTEELSELSAQREAVIAACLKKEQERRDEAVARRKKIVQLEAQINTAVAEKMFIEAAKLNEELEKLRQQQNEPATNATVPAKQEDIEAAPEERATEANDVDSEGASSQHESESSGSDNEQDDSSYEESEDEDDPEEEVNLEYVREQLVAILSERAPEKLATVDNLIAKLEENELSFDTLKREVQQTFGSSIQPRREVPPPVPAPHTDSLAEQHENDTVAADAEAADAETGEAEITEQTAALKVETAQEKEQRLLEQQEQKLKFFDDYFRQV